MDKPRTTTQNAALHLYFKEVAEALNGAGLSVQATLQNYKMELDWSQEAVKDLIWRPVQIALTKKRSTTELAKHGEITDIYEHVNRFLSQMGVHVPFPEDTEKTEMNSNYHSSRHNEYGEYAGDPDF